MNQPTADASDWTHAVSLIAHLQQATDQPGYRQVVPRLGMARAELSDFGQRPTTVFMPTDVTSLSTGLAELQTVLRALLAASPQLRDTLRIGAALHHVDQAAAALQ